MREDMNKALGEVVTSLAKSFDQDKRESEFYKDLESAYEGKKLGSALELLSLRQYNLARTFVVFLQDKGYKTSPASMQLALVTYTEIHLAREMITAREGRMEVRSKSVGEIKNRLLDTFA